MELRKSSFVHLIEVSENSVLLLHAISQARLKVDPEVARLIEFFNQARPWPEACRDLMAFIPYDEPALAACVQGLVEREFLTFKREAEEREEISKKLSPTHGRDPTELLEKYRREKKEGSKSYWAAETAQGLSDLKNTKKRIDVILLGDCDVHMEADFLRQEAAQRGYDLRVAATAPDDFAFAADHVHDVIIVGALYARYFLTQKDPNAEIAYAVQAEQTLRGLRKHTSVPILISNLPDPSVTPLGIADNPVSGHRAHFRRANLALDQTVSAFKNVYIVDLPKIFGEEGYWPLLDDWQVGFTHMGSASWMMQRPESEKRAVHGLMPKMSDLAALIGEDPYRRERVMAKAHFDMIVSVLALEQKKCIIVDLDNTLWPGVLAETGAPFAWTPEISGAFSYIGLYFGIHEALLCLKQRGIVLACVSKNDYSVVKDLWTYPENNPRSRLLMLDDFVTTRINWENKPDNIKSIIEELGFAPETFLFIDDNPIERDRVKQFLPEVEVWGENLFDLRRRILTDPRLQPARLTDEASRRTDLVKAQVNRQSFRAEAKDEESYRASLEIKTRIERLSKASIFDRIEELFLRTTQFNATGQQFSTEQLEKLSASSDTALFALYVSDRFGDHGLVGACVIEANEITGLVLSCRVLGMGIEHTFLRHILSELKPTRSELIGKIIETSRNLPVRNIYRDNGFKKDGNGAWFYKF